VERRKVLLCSGSHCRKALRRNDRLERALSQLPVSVERVGCQKVCKGPVVGLAVDGEWQWFRRVDSRKAVRALAELVEEGTIPKALRKRRDPNRAGKRRS
jgi:(2Fe-2S) ferredoxin